MNSSLPQKHKNKVIFTWLVFFFSLSVLPYLASADTKVQVKQGGIARMILKPGGPISSISGRFKDKKVPYFETGKGVYVALVGIDMDQSLGTLPFVSTWQSAGKTFTQKNIIEVQAAEFGLQELTLPKKKVDLDPPTLKRVRGEKSLMKTAFAESHPERLWKGTFIAPVEGRRQGTFGRRRLINGKPRRSHTGEDISAPTGTPIRAPNAGKVVLVGHFFFNGRSVVIDHGLGLMSMYFHLSAVDVKQGVLVEIGEQIGLVGKSGRVTGPHLHWGMRLNDAKVDPYAFVDVQLD
ncbi:Phage endopeptidase [hydrothermal vent metagenome]|uniref:Phage endopeptidase n=1 Tax=hydrothermal vent metagenome TaxID=652676 RepID=A0A3B1D8C2_9ZZZZ